MNTQLFIASKIKVGFNMRADTYTGKLGYVIGFDGKKWRKEPSWEGWREKYVTDEAMEEEKKKQYEQRIAQYERNIKNYKEYGTQYEGHVKAQEKELEKLKNNYEGFKPNTYSSKWSKDKGIIPVEYDNVPTEGFVLNKKAGGGSRGWDARATYCRVWDPRGFEFEISIPNLLFILQETNSVKGKGLEGEFVYSWDGKDLVLLPCGCQEYQASKGFTKLQSNKIGVKDLIEGASYKTKKEETLIYLGKFNWYEMKYKSEVGRRKYEQDQETNMEKRYIFYNEKNRTTIPFSGLVHLATRLTDTPVNNYAELMDKFNNLQSVSAPKSIEEIPKEINFDEEEFKKNLDNGGYHNSYLKGDYFLKEGNRYILCHIHPETKHIHDYDLMGRIQYGKGKTVFQGLKYYKGQVYTFKNGILTKHQQRGSCDWSKPLSKEELGTKGFLDLKVVLENGKKYDITNF